MSKVKINKSRRRLIQSAGSIPIAVSAPNVLSNHHHREQTNPVVSNLDEIYPRWKTDSAKWDLQTKRFPGQKIHAAMGIADLDFKTAPEITKAIAERVLHENWGYILTPDSYYESIIEWILKRYGEKISRDQLLLSTGVLPAIQSAIRAFCPKNSKVVLNSPGYTELYASIRKADCMPDESPLIKKNGMYSLDFPDLSKRLARDDVHAFLLVNPHNPTGNCWSRDDLKKVAEICDENDVMLFSDEIHCDFIADDAQYTPVYSLETEAVRRKAIIFKSTTKAFNLSAFKTGYVYAHDAEIISKIRQAGHVEFANTLGVIASEVAYTHSEKWLNEVSKYINQNMILVEKYIRKNIPLIRFYRPEGTYLAWIDFTEWMSAIDAKEKANDKNEEEGDYMERYLVEKTGIQLGRGYRFGSGGEKYLRMNVGTSKILLKEALDRIKMAADDL